MNFEEFRNLIENQLNSLVEFELLEYHYQPSSFGNGTLAYRIKGRNHKFVYDGREKEMTWFISAPHQKYFGADFSEFKKIEGLEINFEELKSGI